MEFFRYPLEPVNFLRELGPSIHFQLNSKNKCMISSRKNWKPERRVSNPIPFAPVFARLRPWAYWVHPINFFISYWCHLLLWCLCFYGFICHSPCPCLSNLKVSNPSRANFCEQWWPNQGWEEPYKCNQQHNQKISKHMLMIKIWTKANLRYPKWLSIYAFELELRTLQLQFPSKCILMIKIWTKENLCYLE